MRKAPRPWGLLALVGLLAGAVAGACATSDQVLEQKRRQSMLEDGESCLGDITIPCYDGPDGTAGRGACQSGSKTCNDGTWGACEDAVGPREELCNLVDDDCDGIVDNGFERDGALCFYAEAKGACRTQGKWHCSADGKTSACDAPVVKPVSESCDGIDNDCDGLIDETPFKPDQIECATGKDGVCSTGTRKCVQGDVQCIQNIKPGPEKCNGKDDDCDGEIDNDCV